MTTPTKVPPQTAWAFLTKPGQRMSWQPWVTAVEIKNATGGRRGLDSANHCMHGPNAVIEEILDWRPPQYWMTKTTVSAAPGSPQFLKTEEFSATSDGGTRIDLTIGTVEGRTPDEDRDLMAFIEGNIEGAIEAVMAAVDAVASARARSAVPSPEPPPSRGRHLSEPVRG